MDVLLNEQVLLGTRWERDAIVVCCAASHTNDYHDLLTLQPDVHRGASSTGVFHACRAGGKLQVGTEL